MVQILVEDTAERHLTYDLDLAEVINSLKQDIDDSAEGILLR